MTHGTLQCDDKAASDPFYQDVLELDIVGGGGDVDLHQAFVLRTVVYRRAAHEKP
jgi:hypothetical protein